VVAEWVEDYRLMDHYKKLFNCSNSHFWPVELFPLLVQRSSTT
jgi:hypothetical protein